MKHFIRSLGAADWLVTKGNDNSCYTLDDKVLIDTGSAAGVTLINEGIDPVNLSTICFTHMHADHCIGLLQLLLYWRIKKGSLEELTLVGPAQTLRAQFMKAFEYVFPTPNEAAEVLGLPKLLELQDGDRFETDDYDVQVISSDHAVPGLCYRFVSKQDGRVACFSGDTLYRAEYGSFFQDTDVLVYEASAGAGPVNPNYNHICKHSSAIEAVQVAREAHVQCLLLTHSPRVKWEAAVNYAQSQLTIPVSWATPLTCFPF